MRVILSRKGTDSAYGGLPSPMVPGEPLSSLPIPSVGSPPDARTYREVLRGGEPLSQVIASLAGRRRESLPRTQRPPRQRVRHCHLDPDLDASALAQRPAGWRGALGQSGAAAGHLAGQGVCEGDLFLFFGWFRQAERTPEGLRFVRGAPDVHALFGWLQIGKRWPMGPEDLAPPWLGGHPHLAPSHRAVVNNTVFAASDRLSLEPRLPGWGLFTARDERVLTAPGHSRSRWRLPEPFRACRISYHPAGRAWREGLFHSAHIGQEFVVHADEAVLEVIGGWLEGEVEGA